MCLMLCTRRRVRSARQSAEFEHNRQLAIGNRQYSNRGLAMRDEAQQTIDAQMQQYINDDRDYQRQHQRVAAVRARTRHDSSKRSIKRISHSDDKTNEAGAAPGGQQSQQEAHSQQRIDHPKDVIDNLRDTSCQPPASDFALSLDNFVNSLRAELARNLIDSVAFRRGFVSSTLGSPRCPIARSSTT